MTKSQGVKPVGTKTVNEDASRFKVTGDMAGSIVVELESGFLNQIKTIQNGEVVLDIKEVNKIDSNGISLCIGLKKECIKKGMKFIVEANTEINKLFKMLKLIENTNTGEAGAI